MEDYSESIKIMESLWGWDMSQRQKNNMITLIEHSKGNISVVDLWHEFQRIEPGHSPDRFNIWLKDKFDYIPHMLPPPEALEVKYRNVSIF